MSTMSDATVASREMILAPWLSLAAALGLLVPLLGDTFPSMVRQWLTASTYQHGFLIPMISAWLAWRVRFKLTGIQPSPSASATAGVIAAGCLWAVGSLSDVLLLQQVAAVALIPLCIWAVAGPEFVKSLAFPCGYLFFMIPFGDFLLPYLMKFTAQFIMTAVTAFGVPIYRDGLVLSTASGNFEVIYGCAGLKYLLASGSLAVLFSYLVYQSWWKRVTFIVAALTISILANGVRAATVVLIAHYTHMRLGTGSDHILFGQILFGVVTLLTLLVGLTFSDPQPGEIVNGKSADRGHNAFPAWSLPAAAGLFLALVSLAPISANAIKSRTAGAEQPEVLQRLPIAESPWTGPFEASSDSTPVFPRATSVASGQYRYATEWVDVHVISYRSQEQSRELINGANSNYDPRIWTAIGQTTSEVPTHGVIHKYTETELRSANGTRRLLRIWYSVNGKRTNSPLVVKAMELQSTLMGQPAVSSAFLIGTSVGIDIAHAREVLDQFMVTELARKMEKPAQDGNAAE